MRRSKALRRAQIREEMGLNRPPPHKRRWYEANWFKVIELAAIIVGVGFIVYEVIQRERVDRPVAEATLNEIRNSQIERSWTVMLDAGRSINERVDAVNSLISTDYDLGGLDFRCPQDRPIRAFEVIEEVECTGGYLRNLVMSSETAYLQGGHVFNGVLLLQGDFSDLWCIYCRFVGTEFKDVNLSDAHFMLSDLTDAKIDTDAVVGMSISSSNVSGLIFEGFDPSEVTVNRSWFFESNPPVLGNVETGNLESDRLEHIATAVRAGFIACDKEPPLNDQFPGILSPCEMEREFQDSGRDLPN